MSKLTYYIVVEPISAEVFQQINFEKGRFYYGSIGTILLEPGTLVSLSHGREFLNYTQSGKAYESEFPHGKINAFAIPAQVILQKNEMNKFTTMEFEKIIADKIIEQQKISYTPQLEKLIQSFSQSYLEKQEQNAKIYKEQNEKRKEMLQKTFQQIEKAFSPNLNTKSSSKPK
jgi:hypothetical protein